MTRIDRVTYLRHSNALRAQRKTRSKRYSINILLYNLHFLDTCIDTVVGSGAACEVDLGPSLQVQSSLTMRRFGVA